MKSLKHAEKTGHVGRTCRYFGTVRVSFYRWKAALEKHGEVGLIRKKPIGTVRNLVRGAGLHLLAHEAFAEHHSELDPRFVPLPRGLFPVRCGVIEN